MAVDPHPLQAGFGTVRVLGFAAVGLIALAFLYWLVRYDDGTADPVYEDENDDDGLPSFGPAYGAGGDDVETVLGIEDQDDDRTGAAADPEDADAASASGSPADEWGADTPDWGDLAGAGALDPESEGGDDDPDPGPVLDHAVLDDPRDAVLVEVTGGDRSGRFYVADPDAAPTIEPASPATERLDAEWRRTAEDYLRAVVLAGDLGGERELE